MKMRRSPLKPSKRELARQIIAQYHQEQEALRIREKLEAARIAYDARPRVGPKFPPKILPCKEMDPIKLQKQKPMIMKTIDGRGCAILDKTYPGLVGEPLTVPEITFDNGNPPITLNRDTLRMFSGNNRMALEEYLEDVETMNEEYSLIWTA